MSKTYFTNSAGIYFIEKSRGWDSPLNYRKVHCTFLPNFFGLHLKIWSSFLIPPNSIENKKDTHGVFFCFGAEGGIRTHAPFRTNGFQDRLVMTTSIPLLNCLNILSYHFLIVKCFFNKNTTVLFSPWHSISGH